MDLTARQRKEIRARLLEEFPKLQNPEVFDVNTKTGAKMLNDTLDFITDRLIVEPASYYDFKAVFDPDSIIHPPKAYRRSMEYEDFESFYLSQCQEELAAGLPTGVFDFNVMKSYPNNEKGAYLQGPVGLYQICSVGLPYPHHFPEFETPMESKYRLVIDDESGIDLYIAPDEQEAIGPTFAGLYLVAPGIVQLTLKTVVYDDPSHVEKMMEKDGPLPAHLQAAIDRGSYFMHVSLLKTTKESGEVEWVVEPGMTEDALDLNMMYINSDNKFGFPSKSNVPFVRNMLNEFMANPGR